MTIHLFLVFIQATVLSDKIQKDQNDSCLFKYLLHYTIVDDIVGTKEKSQVRNQGEGGSQWGHGPSCPTGHKKDGRHLRRLIKRKSVNIS